MAWSDIPGWFSFGHAYDAMVAESKDGEAIVEVGVAFGRSLAYLARQVIDSGKDVTVIGVDPWCPGWQPSGQDWDKPENADRPVGGWGGEHARLVEQLGGPYKAFEHMMRTHANHERILCHTYRGESADAASNFKRNWSVPLRGVLIDANHSYPSVIADIKAWWPLVMPGGIMAGDDYHAEEFPGVVQAVHEFFGQLGVSVEVKGTTWFTRKPK